MLEQGLPRALQRHGTKSLCIPGKSSHTRPTCRPPGTNPGNPSTAAPVPVAVPASHDSQMVLYHYGREPQKLQPTASENSCSCNGPRLIPAPALSCRHRNPMQAKTPNCAPYASSKIQTQTRGRRNLNRLLATQRHVHRSGPKIAQSCRWCGEQRSCILSLT